jgi:acyl-coenzyme A synthetase/AMP-(fatty) acid ligase
VVAIYMPNAIEAFTAVHACNRIGAIYTILFSGFGSDAVRSRLEASRAKAVIVLDASYRRGKLTPLLDTLRAARGRVATVQQTIVVTAPDAACRWKTARCPTPTRSTSPPNRSRRSRLRRTTRPS